MYDGRLQQSDRSRLDYTDTDRQYDYGRTAPGRLNVNGQVVFQPNGGLSPGIYYDTIHYQVCDKVDVPSALCYGLCSRQLAMR